MTKTLETFREKFDPTYERMAPTAVYSRELPKGVRRFLITAAQNGTPVDSAWWAVLQRITKETSAEILVIPLRYKNPTSRWNASQGNEEWWAPEVTPYLWNVRYQLNENLTLLADIKTQPTMSSPLDGADAISLSASGILGHTKLQLRSIPTPTGRMAKILTTTGACTVSNYTDSRVGKVAEFHHSLSAVLVEREGKRFHLRHVHFDAKTQSCTDLNRRYTAKGSTAAPRPFALSMGDTHVDFIDPIVKHVTFGKGGIIATTRPKHLIWHDVLDSYSCNAHHYGDRGVFEKVAKRAAQRDDVRAEVNRAIRFVREHTPDDTISVIVGSNHNDMLRRWILRGDWKQEDGPNGDFYLETALVMRRGAQLTEKGTEYPDPFTHWFREARVPNTRVLDVDESFSYANVELGMHGDLGPNGARGSIRNLRRIGVKSIIGHSHRPGIDEGCYQNGTSTLLRLEYNHGASAWLNAHTLLHADGKRQIIIIVDGHWKL